MVEGSMTQGAGQGPEVERTATVRDFRVPAYVHETAPYAAPGTHTGESAPPSEEELEEALPEGYTPTQRDLPVIRRGDTVQVTVEPAPAAVQQPATGQGPLFVVGDVHGYLDELLAALREKGLVDDAGQW
ncbi:Ser/Thr/Tyr protein phosphatase SppA, partial [Micromonospora chalcea]